MPVTRSKLVSTRLSRRSLQLSSAILATLVIGALVAGWSDGPASESTPLNYDTAQTTYESQYSVPPLPNMGYKHRGFVTSSLYVTVPLWMGVDRDIVRPGGSIEGRIGLNYGYIVPELELGFSWTPIDLTEVESGYGRNPLKDFFFGIGLRFQVPNDSIITPFLSAAFDFAFWNFRETGISCGWWYCSSRGVYRFAPGISGRVGVGIELHPLIDLDVGLKLAMTFPGKFFEQTRWWLAPMVGFTAYW